jgi:hypothetical protein
LILLRPGAVDAILAENHPGENVLCGQIVQVLLQAGHTRLVIAVGEYGLVFEWEGTTSPGASVILSLKSKEISFLLTEN